MKHQPFVIRTKLQRPHFGVQVWYFVSQPDAFGPEWQIRVSISPVIKAPW